MIIPFFLMNGGCRHRCLFCNERLTTGAGSGRIERLSFDTAVRTCLAGPRRRGGPVQIAFYGGTFTGLPPAEQRRLLSLAAPFLHAGTVEGIRISTRPDEIDAAGLSLLAASGVTTVELGAQSLDDDILKAVQRGHGAAEVVRALALLKERGFQTGLHLMVGLPGDDPRRFAATIARTIALKPDTVRLHPTLVLRDTPLAEAFARGTYHPLTLTEAVALCSQALEKLTAAAIPVIRLGLQGTAELEQPGAIVAGPYHPAFGSLVTGAWLCERAGRLWSSPAVQRLRLQPGTAPANAGAAPAFSVSPADLTPFLGPQRQNAAALANRCGLRSLAVAADAALPRGVIALTLKGRRFQVDPSGRISGP